MRVADAPYLADPLRGARIAEMTPERVARIGRIRDDPAVAQDIGRLPDQARLRVDRMDLEGRRHGRRRP